MEKQNKVYSEFSAPDIPQRITSRKKQIVLTEEDYITQLGKIIQRDFFPDLEKLKVQNEYLDAFERNDTRKLHALYAKYSGNLPRAIHGSKSPATFETPSTIANTTPRFRVSVTEDTMRAEYQSHTNIPNNHTLDTFLRMYTSEDNESFQNIIETAKEKLRQRLVELYKIKPTALTNGIVENISKEIHTYCSKSVMDITSTNSIMFIPDGVELTANEKLDMTSRKQKISYFNTRLAQNPFNENQNKQTITELAKTQAKNLTGKIGVDGNVVVQNNVQNIRGFDFMKTPSPYPGEVCTPLMTWGEIEGTPFKLDGSDTPVRTSVGPSFRINETSRREAIALELAEKAGERMRGQKQKAINCARRNIATPHMRSTMERLASMSPAAKRLASMKLGLRTAILTPSPRTSSLLTPRRYLRNTLSPTIRKKIPLVVTRRGEENKPDLTDDLLKIPSSRPKASDFF